MQPRLADLQQLLCRLITAPNGVEEGLGAERCLPAGGLDALVVGDAHVSAIERVTIYANMYFYRLLDAIKEDFPATLAILGEVNFHNLITGYLIAYPPSQPSIADESRHLAAFASSSEWIDRFPYLADLVRVERAIVEVFLAPDAIPLSLEELRLTPPSEWPSIRLGLHPAVQLLACDWRVDDLLRATEERGAVGLALHKSNTIMVWRKKYACHRALEEVELNALAALCWGEEFVLACERIAAPSEEVTTTKLSEMLLRWVADGVVVRVR
jgi:hypothetical protein